MFLETGNSPLLFWDMSLGEIMDVIESYNRKKEAEEKQFVERYKLHLIANEVQAQQICEKAFGKGEYTPLSVFFPDLFKETSSDETEMELYKAKMENYAFWHNQRKGGDTQ